MGGWVPARTSNGNAISGGDGNIRPRSQHAIVYHKKANNIVIHDVEMELRSNIGNHVMQGQVHDKNGKLTNDNRDGQMKTVDVNVKATVGNGDKQLLAEKNVKKADRNSVAQKQIKGKGDKVHAVKVPSVYWNTKVQVLGLLTLNLSLTNDIMDLKEVYQQFIGTTFKTVHPAFLAVFGNDFIKMLWITESNPKKGSCEEEYRQEFLSAHMTITDTLTALDYVEPSQSWLFDKKISGECIIVYGQVFDNSANFDK